MRDLLPFLRLYRQHWLSLSLGLLLALVTLIAGMGLLSLSGWFLSAAAVAGLTVASSHAFNYMTPAGGVRFFSIIRTAGRWGDRVVSHDATFKVLTRLRVWFWQRLAPLSTGSRGQFRQADLLNRLVADIDALDHVYLRLLTPIGVALLGSLAMVGFLSLFDPRLALILGSILLVSMVLLPILFYHLGKRPGRLLIEQKAHLRTRLLDYLGAQAELQMFAAAEELHMALRRDERDLIEAQATMARITGLSSALMTLISGWSLALMLWLAGHGVAGQAPDPVTALMVFATLASFEALMPLAGAFLHLTSSLTAARRLNQVLEQAEPTTYGEQREPARGDLVMERLLFVYPGSDTQVLQGVSLTLAAGEKVALLGQTGCGKSTLLSLVTREWEPTAGTLTLGGIPLSDYSESALRGAMTVVSQRIHLFSDTLRANLLLAAPAAPDERLAEVLTRVGLGRLLDDDGLDTWLGEGGRSLSGGEQRRIGIARALLHDAPLWLLDEPTEGLDRQTEQAIMGLLHEVCAERSVLLITHRLTGLAQMDRIALMEEGKILRCAPHGELMVQDDHYRRLHQRLTPA
ncbi:heme ABC transporter ATP-binding protein/permease CydC [Aeromonas schubertii]|uniref:Glutathione/L-cysteine transport system ATP-binding/permease protein CydC n=1 Tax=Aeromonas schubertii TaxID=652 RepID=A0A0S2SKL0_9GAMM|nr:cysteine/glutathione ABC transporter ATP-binding protein/permease CydC [Aeromonas schubertii]ALP42234.1 amino acid ABC transporter permease [Aeromonas schubertii]